MAVKAERASIKLTVCAECVCGLHSSCIGKSTRTCGCYVCRDEANLYKARAAAKAKSKYRIVSKFNEHRIYLDAHLVATCDSRDDADEIVDALSHY